ncbi:hypothetical protein [Marinicella gelatinilytica]|uniref:hypothetical protein n=1 Tax=Marinicella gelatinilytica TaxID=2996017 RepID=UPI002260AF5D|nr:hypothetical protein [Marinicella gelatinilytica]MCX7545746.1 hypothetical protein [Marinicella gelatinilytica]
MRRKWVSVFICLLLTLLFFAFYFKYERSKTNSNNTSTEIETNPPLNTQQQIDYKEKVPKSGKTSEPYDLSSKEEINGIPISRYLAEIKNPIYSDDPVIEIASLSMDFQVCRLWYHRLNKNISSNPDLQQLKNQLTEKCELYGKKYPVLFESSSQHDSVLNFKANSLLGEQYKYLLAGLYGRHNDIDYNQLTENLFELSLQIRSPSLISVSALNSGIGLSAADGKTEFFKDLLHTQVNIWIFHAHNLALQLLTCDMPNSQTCEATSFHMLYRCDNEPVACGLTLQQWHMKYSSLGMKKDVEIIKNYYRDNYL